MQKVKIKSVRQIAHRLNFSQVRGGINWKKKCFVTSVRRQQVIQDVHR